MNFILITDPEKNLIKADTLFKMYNGDTYILLSSYDDNLTRYENWLTSRDVPQSRIIKCNCADTNYKIIDRVIQILFIFGKLKSKMSRLDIVGDESRLSSVITEMWDAEYIPYYYN